MIGTIMDLIYRVKFKIKLFLIEFDINTFLLNLFIFSTLGFSVYLINKFNIIFNESITNFKDSITLTIYVVTLYGIFFAFLQFLIGNRSNRFFYWGTNKIKFSILNKFIYRLVNIFATKLIIIAFIIVPIASFIISELNLSLLSDNQSILNIIWEVSLIYLVVAFGFLLTKSLTALFLVFEIENNADRKIKNNIKKFMLKQALLGVKKGYFWYYFDDQKKCIEKDQLFHFTSFIFNGVLEHICRKIPKAKQDIYLYHKKSKMPLDSFLNERWKHSEGLSVEEKIKLLENENKSLNIFFVFCKHHELFNECLINTENLLEPFYDILSEIKSSEDMEFLLKTISSYKYFDFSEDEHGYSEHAYRISSQLFFSIKNNFSTITNDTVKNYLVELNKNKKAIAKSFFKLIYLHEWENSENEKEFIKFMLGTLGLNYIYAFIFYCVLHYGSPSETVLQEEIYYFRELYLLNNKKYEIIDIQKICDLVEDTNIGHKVESRLISWLLNNMNNDLNNEVLDNIYSFKYLNYSKFLKIRFIFSDGYKEGRFSYEFFDDVKTNELNKNTIDEIINSYFAYISSNIESLNFYFMSEHHKAFIKKFEDYILAFLENQLKYSNYNCKHIILYLIKDVPKVQEYLLCKKFIFKYDFSGDFYFESYFIDFIMLVFEDAKYFEVFSKDYVIKTHIKNKLEFLSKEGELNDYLENLYLSIDKCRNFKKIKNIKTKILEYFEIGA
ncbi:hypothetical protein P40081_03945 [Paenibacillus sp. FSL P4-0081]|uniref:hypothetical protein n=1 Tax=Paenibacillus sp. FSL P4-0081 TaxID=1536769 RepID=UPI0004F5A717|nr:hypothetical protein [Paenibacillus sp. FSL P4-0081]AIQ27445.1 hypothetical protein P40081_03945 [Paenibacillus sp. FSL P4-0081]